MKKVLIGIVVIALIFVGIELLGLVKDNKANAIETTDSEDVEIAKKNPATDSTEEKEEIVISVLMPARYYFSGSDGIGEVKNLVDLIVASEFDYDDNVRVEIVEMKIESYQDFLTQRGIILHSNNAPTIVLDYLQKGAEEIYVDSGFADFLPDKLSNYDNVYDSMKLDYFVPIGIRSPGTFVNTEILEQLELDIPDANWDSETYEAIYEKWLDEYAPYITDSEYEYVFNSHFSYTKFIDSNKTVKVNMPEIIDSLKVMRDKMFSDDYTREESVENSEYVKLINPYDWDTGEANESSKANQYQQSNESSHFLKSKSANILHPLEAYHSVAYSPYKILPAIKPGYVRFGAIVNVGGKNKDVAYTLIDHMLSDKYQLYMYEKKMMDSLTPSIKTIEDKIKSTVLVSGGVEVNIPQEFYDSRDVVIKKIINKEPLDYDNYIIKDKFFKVSSEIIFADEYLTDDAIEEILTEFEQKMFLYFNE